MDTKRDISPLVVIIVYVRRDNLFGSSSRCDVPYIIKYAYDTPLKKKERHSQHIYS
jgi:hypothetical protein